MIEKLTATDARLATLLWEECDLTRPWNDARADFMKAIAGPCSAVLGLRQDGHLVGTVMVGYDGHRAGPTTWPSNPPTRAGVWAVS